ncbi:SDR family oxidoreductase [Brucella pseudogrignonensis]|uniref:SDR family oxidoreductase n=1 Tax=Brucella pseudogrignonensis TaxID=419475 RepID=UPI001EDB6D52|nr:SDR family oxidoreductase [Brucella pseudogrignonensis]UKK94688.1 SDR family oxidoreductase [Brucella pseudogrignonensis]
MAQEKVALVTGASRGIGSAIAKRLAHDGFSVIVNYAGGSDAAAAVVREIEAAGGKAITAQADVSDAGAVKRMFDSAESAFGGVDVLVNNAGIMMLSPLATADEAHVTKQTDINLKGTINTLREAATRLRSGGSIVNFSTSVVGLKLETYSVYAATKAAVETLTAIMAKEMRGRSITVNAVAPGPTATDLFLNGKSDELIERMSKMNPLERLGTPEDIASAVAFLAGPDGSWINGQVLRANGGMI